MDLLKTVVCFEKSSKIEGEVVGFVVYRPKTDTFDTVPESSELKKKIVVLHPDLKGEVKAGNRYWVDMIPMRSNKGFIAVLAEEYVISKVECRVGNEVCIKNTCYQFEIWVKDSVFKVDLMSKTQKECDIQWVASGIKASLLENEEPVLKNVMDTYHKLARQMEADGVVRVIDGKVVS